nr:exonuclease 3'-5' domain-containing protein 2-like [Lepeophtheirus salmonis]
MTRLLAPDGELLCTCDNRKASWYVSKGLGTYDSSSTEKVMVVRLSFEPQGRPIGTHGEYYTKDKENRCVVCGREDFVLKKYIVPREYRKHFPQNMRDHQSHDVLLLCFLCHKTWGLKDLQLRRKLSKHCNAPLSTQLNETESLDVMEVKSIISAARALSRNNGKIPQDRVNILESTLLDYFDADEITDSLLQKACSLKPNFKHDVNYSHGKLVFDHFTSDEQGIESLEILWRMHFLSTMEPKFLPELWSVNHHQNESIKCSNVNKDTI